MRRLRRNVRFSEAFNYHKHLRDHGNYENKLLGDRGKGSGKAGTTWPSLWTEQLRALRDVALSRVLIVGTPARFGAGTPAVKVASSKRRNSPEFTCRARVCLCVWKNCCFNSSGIAHTELSGRFPFFPFARAARLCSRAVMRSGWCLPRVMLFGWANWIALGRVPEILGKRGMSWERHASRECCSEREFAVSSIFN